MNGRCLAAIRFRTRDATRLTFARVCLPVGARAVGAVT